MIYILFKKKFSKLYYILSILFVFLLVSCVFYITLDDVLIQQQLDIDYSESKINVLSDSQNNTPAYVYEALAEARICVNSLSLFFNSSNNRYEVKVTAQAQTSGSDANVSAGKIVNVISGVNQSVGVINEQAFSFGTDPKSQVASPLTRGPSLQNQLQTFRLPIAKTGKDPWRPFSGQIHRLTASS